MAITLQFPDDVERQLRAAYADLERRVAEGYAVEAFRRGELSSHQVCQMLGLGDRWQAIEFLTERGAYPGYDTVDFAEDVRNLAASENPSEQQIATRQTMP